MTFSAEKLRKKKPHSTSEIVRTMMLSKKSCLQNNNDDKQDNKSNATKKKNVSFHHQIEIREFPIILGDNPSAHDGIPISIGWKPQRREFCDIDDYDKQQQQYDRRHGNELILSAKYRFELAILGGATVLEIGEVSVSVTTIQKHRAQSSQKSSLELIREGLDRKLIHFHRNHHHNQQQQQQQVPSCTFSRVPNEAPWILSTWKANGERFTMYTNAAA